MAIMVQLTRVPGATTHMSQCIPHHITSFAGCMYVACLWSCVSKFGGIRSMLLCSTGCLEAAMLSKRLSHRGTNRMTTPATSIGVSDAQVVALSFDLFAQLCGVRKASCTQVGLTTGCRTFGARMVCWSRHGAFPTVQRASCRSRFETNLVLLILHHRQSKRTECMNYSRIVMADKIWPHGSGKLTEPSSD